MLEGRESSVLVSLRELMSQEEERVRSEREQRARAERERLEREEAEKRARAERERLEREEAEKRALVERERLEQEAGKTARLVFGGDPQQPFPPSRLPVDPSEGATPRATASAWAEQDARVQRLEKWLVAAALGPLAVAAGCAALYFAKLQPEWEARQDELARKVLETGSREIALLRERQELRIAIGEVEARYRAEQAISAELRRSLEALPKPPRTTVPPHKPTGERVRAAEPACTCDPHDPLCGCFR
jgi:colicin import membrane protein